MTEVRTREAVAIFDDLSKLDEAVDALKAEQFPRHAINVIGNQQKLEERFGAEAIKPEWLADNPNTPRGISVRPEEKAIGAGLLVAVPAYILGCVSMLIVNPASPPVLLSAVAIGSIVGAFLGGLALFLINLKLKKKIEKQIRKGGLLLWVGTPELESEKTAIKVLKKYGGRHVHINGVND